MPKKLYNRIFFNITKYLVANFLNEIHSRKIDYKIKIKIVLGRNDMRWDKTSDLLSSQRSDNLAATRYSLLKT